MPSLICAIISMGSSECGACETTEQSQTGSVCYERGNRPFPGEVHDSGTRLMRS
jgi:hypothetical protein